MARDTPERIKHSGTEFGKLPPQALDLEEAVLGALIIGAGEAQNILEMLKPELFYSPAHQLILKAILNLFEKRQSVDMLTVTQELIRLKALDEAGGVLYITELSSRVVSTVHIDTHVRILIEKALKRQALAVSQEMTQKGFDEGVDAFELQEWGVEQLMGLSASYLVKQDESVDQVGKGIDTKMQQLQKDKKAGKVTRLIEGVSTGFDSVDSEMGGFMKKELVYIGARPGEGKTAMILNMALNQAKRGIASGIFSLEMDADSLFIRLACIESGIDFEMLKKGTTTVENNDTFMAASEKIRKLPIYIDCTRGLDKTQALMKATRMQRKHGIKILYVDYVQIMGGKFRNREERVGENSKGLKDIASELDIPVVSLSQIKREYSEKRGSKGSRYEPGDLKYSGEMEDNADIIMFIYRPWVHGEKEDADGSSTEKLAHIDVKKNKNGSLFGVKMMFEKGTYREWVDGKTEAKYDAETDIPF